MTSIALAIYSSPKPHGAAECAFKLAQTLVTGGHDVARLFFFNDGVYNSIAQSDHGLPQQWSEFIQTHDIDAVVCVASAEKRGIHSNLQQQPEADKPAPLPGFQIAGLAQLIDAAFNADRVITFSD